MKLMKNMNVVELAISDLVELLTTVSFRIMGFQFVVLTFYYLILLKFDRSYWVDSNVTDSYRNHATQVYLTEITFHAVTAVVMFMLSGPLARLICRGLFGISNKNIAPN